jgi:hypothetical protein
MVNSIALVVILFYKLLFHLVPKASTWEAKIELNIGSFYSPHGI